MLKSEEYFDITLNNNQYKSYKEKLVANDYDCPVRVFSIDIPDTEVILKNLGADEYDIYENLPDTLKQQINNRVSFLTIASKLNYEKNDTNAVVVYNNYTAGISFKKYSLSKPIAYLYIFETGKPILVLFRLSVIL